MQHLSETILQFGGGRFLRAFVDAFVHQANMEGQAVGRVVVVQSTAGERAHWLNAQAGRYHVLTRGREHGQVVDRADEVASISRALVAQTEWSDILALATSPELRTVVSNTTEKGLALDAEDRAENAPPRSFPARLLALLKHRYDHDGTGLTILPCELIEHNAAKLRGLVVEQARLWNYDAGFVDWLHDECVWLNSLVDRIVSGPPAAHPLLAEDKLLCVAEPYALWVVEDPTNAAPLFAHPALHRCADATPFYLRKVRILNGAHTALVCKAVPLGFTTVREAVEDPAIHAWLERLLFEEIVPTLAGRVDAPDVFARHTLERFANPFLEHKFADIALYHDTKLQVRLLPTRDEYRRQFGQEPLLLNQLLADYA